MPCIILNCMQSLNRPTVIKSVSIYIFPKVCTRLSLSEIWGDKYMDVPSDQILGDAFPPSPPVHGYATYDDDDNTFTHLFTVLTIAICCEFPSWQLAENFSKANSIDQ